MAELLNFRLEAIQSAEEKKKIILNNFAWIYISHSTCLLDQSSYQVVNWRQ